jgi:hemolysin D
MDLENQKTVKTNFSYRMHIAPDPGSTLIVDGKRAALKPGMSVQADVQTDKRKIYEFVFAPVVKYLNEGTQVR